MGQRTLQGIQLQGGKTEITRDLCPPRPCQRWVAASLRGRGQVHAEELRQNEARNDKRDGLQSEAPLVLRSSGARRVRGRNERPGLGAASFTW